MKTRRLLLLTFFPALLLAEPQFGDLLLAEQRFNLPSPGINLTNGARLDEPGSGVSGRVDDLAYLGMISPGNEGRNSSVAILSSPLAHDGLNAITCSFWYELKGEQPAITVPFSLLGIQMLIGDGGSEVRFENGGIIQFNAGKAGTYLPWVTRDQWIFCAFSWDRQSNTLFLYQGTKTQPVALVREIKRPGPVDPVTPRVKQAILPDTYGNAHGSNHDRPVAGKLDNVRLYRVLLTQDAIESIRRADLNNALVPIW